MTDSPLLLPADRQLRVGRYNLLSDGQERWEDQVRLLGGLNLDVLNLQEAKHWDQKDSERAYATAAVPFTRSWRCEAAMVMALQATSCAAQRGTARSNVAADLRRGHGTREDHSGVRRPRRRSRC
ncbi:hypothetical protein [Streptomyces kanamyceticus]|uniref:hypothetical protein n=1 Tax=Streptomyces kanamyceticus TaxID=1967 RepID=UPI0037DC2DAA